MCCGRAQAGSHRAVTEGRHISLPGDRLFPPGSEARQDLEQCIQGGTGAETFSSWLNETRKRTDWQSCGHQAGIDLEAAKDSEPGWEVTHNLTWGLPRSWTDKHFGGGQMASGRPKADPVSPRRRVQGRLLKFLTTVRAKKNEPLFPILFLVGYGEQILITGLSNPQLKPGPPPLFQMEIYCYQ